MKKEIRKWKADIARKKRHKSKLHKEMRVVDDDISALKAKIAEAEIEEARNEKWTKWEKVMMFIKK